MRKGLLPKQLLALLCLSVISLAAASQIKIISFGSSWKYLDNNTRPTGWETTDFEDDGWLSGNGELGYGDNDEVTTVSYGGNASSKYITTYFRKTINIPNPAIFGSFTFNVERDDAFVVYLNGVEVGRNNLAAGPVNHNTLSTANLEDAIISFTIPSSAFTPTYNVIAVEVHQSSITSTDLSFDLELLGDPLTNTVLIPNNSSWRYLDTDTRPANWETSAFADGLWKIGYGELGFGEGDEATSIDGGPTNARYATTYFRKTFNVADSAAFASYVFRVKRDDGFVLYLNGIEAGRNNMPAGTPAHATFASSNVEEEVITFNIPASRLRTGSNTITVEMHQSNATSTDLSFDLTLFGQVTNDKLLPFGSSWKYLDNNTRPAGWETSAFNDASWAAGNGELGYGDNDESTTVSFGGNAGNKYITTYFRKKINIANPAAYSSYTFTIDRDDAYVMYINGTEINRNNMPAGTPTHSTFAANTADDSLVIFTLPNTVFVAGENTIAVEVHQINLSSSDLSFDMEVLGNNNAPQVIIGAKSAWKYLDNNTRPTNWQSTAFDDGTWRMGYGELGYGDGDESTVVSFGPTASAKYITTYFRKTINLENAASFLDYTFSVKRDDGFVLYVNGTERARNNMPAGTPVQGTLASSNIEDSVITFTLPAANFVNGKNVIAVEMHQNNANSSDLSFDLQMFGNYGSLAVIPFNAAWKYLDNNTRPNGWETSLYNDASWATGLAELGYGDGGEATVVSYGPDANNKYITTYFRKTVNIANPSAFANYKINLIRDDGAIVYVNGVEVVRSNMPVPPVTHTTFASSNIANADETAINTFVIPSSYFVSGNNVIAVEVHQDDASSSDLSFNLELVTGAETVADASLINYTDVWKFLDDGSDQGTAWKETSFNDAGWNSGAAKLGYGGDGEATVIGYGPDANNKYRTAYFRKTFTVTNLSQYQSLVINMLRDDGVVVYINGTEVARDNMPAGIVDYQTFATEVIDEGAEESTPINLAIPISAFVEGTNTIAVEVHQVNAASSDLGFSMELIGSSQQSTLASITRSPYLQSGGQTEITVRWRTNVATNSKVEVGTSFGTYPIVVNDANSTTEHIVRVTGLTPDTKYFYRVGSSTEILQGAADNFFRTTPPAGSRTVKIAAFGDCGRNENNFQTTTLTQYRNYLLTNGIDAPDAWILLGDNAYDAGAEADYTNNFFNVYGPNILKNHKMYPTPGNHDYSNGNATRQDDHNVPYYSLFSMPTAGEAGGLASNKKEFYSFDVGDVHFLSLDSYGEESNKRLYDTTGAQVAWVKADLAATDKKWIVAYWHHPPYTKGSHNSDSESELINMRENFIRILERYGVDLIITGHSHDYERSYLLKGYYKQNPGDPQVNEVNFNPLTHTASTSSAKYDGTSNSCPYVYKYAKEKHGTVYVVAGSSGADGGVQSGYPHDALPFSYDDGGMLYFEADSNRLDAKFLRRDGVIADRFTIMHDVNVADTFFIVSGNQVTLNASWGGNYLWNTTATTRTISVTPAEGLTNYTVVDNQGCLKDSFAVYANVCSGGINTWVGNVSTAWENPANWSCGSVPDENSEVMINPGTPHACIVNSDVVVKNITIKTGASVTVTTGFKLDVKQKP